MSRLDFLADARPLTLADIAACGDASLGGDADGSRVFRAAAALDRAGPGDVTALRRDDDQADLPTTRAGACFVKPEDVGQVPARTIAIVAADPQTALRRVLVLMYPLGAIPSLVFDGGGIDRAAVVHGEAMLEAGVAVAPGAVVGPRAEVGTGTTIGANAVIGPGVRIGRNCTIDSHASMQAALIGDRVVVHSGARIGVTAPSSKDTPLAPPLGRVIIQDDVEIGANAVIERGVLRDTTIGEGSKIGALTMVPSEASIGRQTIVESPGISSSRKLV